ncbi:MAG: hypothetical protein ACI32Z_06235, partial [Clostridium sp.]
MSDELMMKILRDFLLLFSRNSGRVSSFILHSSFIILHYFLLLVSTKVADATLQRRKQLLLA